MSGPTGSVESVDPRAFLGQGWAMPVELDASGDVAMVDHDEDVGQAIRIILETAPDERVMRPDFGSGLHAAVFEPITTTTKALLRHRVIDALTRWEPRIDSVEVTVDDRRRAEGILELEITYRVRATNIFYNLVYPFYLTEGQP